MSTEPAYNTAVQNGISIRAPAPGEESSRTIKTEQNYLKRALWFEGYTERNLSIDKPGPLVVAAYALERREEWAKSTWRQNKAALIFRFTSMGTRDALEAVGILRDGSQTPCASKTKRTSGKRAKTISSEALEEIISRVRGSASKFAPLLETWLLLGAEIGLRPHEWGQALLINASPLEMGDVDVSVRIGEFGDAALIPYLRIENAKATNGRSHGKYRHLNLSRLRPGLAEMIGEFASLMSEVVRSGRYQLYYFGCSKLLYRINKSLHGSSSHNFIQLYSPRHKFSSDAKKALDVGSVAALMGHATTKTASEHYGRRVNGTGSLGPRPIESEIIRVRKIRSYKARTLAPADIPSIIVEAY